MLGCLPPLDRVAKVDSWIVCKLLPASACQLLRQQFKRRPRAAWPGNISPQLSTPLARALAGCTETDHCSNKAIHHTMNDPMNGRYPRWQPVSAAFTAAHLLPANSPSGRISPAPPAHGLIKHCVLCISVLSLCCLRPLLRALTLSLRWLPPACAGAAAGCRRLRPSVAVQLLRP